MAGRNFSVRLIALNNTTAYNFLTTNQSKSFNVASRTFAYRRLAQGLSRSLSAFSKFIRECLDKPLKTDQFCTMCRWYWNSRKKGYTTVRQHPSSLWMRQKCRPESIHVKMQFWGHEGRIALRRTITPEGVSPQVVKLKNFFGKIIFPKSKVVLLGYI